MYYLKQIECPFCKNKFFRDLNYSLLPRSKINVCDKCIAKGLEEHQYIEPKPEEELKDKLCNPSSRKTENDEVEELKSIISQEYLGEFGREPTESEMERELRKWVALSKKGSSD